jgi:hypothetical protein
MFLSLNENKAAVTLHVLEFWLPHVLIDKSSPLAAALLAMRPKSFSCER